MSLDSFENIRYYIVILFISNEIVYRSEFYSASKMLTFIRFTFVVFFFSIYSYKRMYYSLVSNCFPVIYSDEHVITDRLTAGGVSRVVKRSSQTKRGPHSSHDTANGKTDAHSGDSLSCSFRGISNLSDLSAVVCRTRYCCLPSLCPTSVPLASSFARGPTETRYGIPGEMELSFFVFNQRKIQTFSIRDHETFRPCLFK